MACSCHLIPQLLRYPRRVRRLFATAIVTVAAVVAPPAATAQVPPVPGTSPTGSAPLETFPADLPTGSGPIDAPTGSGPVDAPTGSGPVETLLGDTPPVSTTTGTLPLVPVPSSCTAPPQPDVVFVGTLVERDFRTGRFAIEQIRAGSGPAQGELIDVRYGLDVEYLEVGERYLVSARRDLVLGLLASKIRSPAPLLGGDDVVGVAESDVECPRFDDPIRTLRPDGSAIDSAVLAPLREHSGQLLGTVLVPIGVAVAILAALATLRLAVGGLVRSVGSAVRHPR